MRKPIPQVRWTRNNVVTVAAAVLILALAIGWLGYWVHAVTHPSKAVIVEQVFTGRVVQLNASGDAGCIAPDNGGAKVCTVLYVDTSEPPLRVGQHVHAAREHVVGVYDLLVIYNPNSD